MGDYLGGLSQAARDATEDVLSKIRDGLQPDSTSSNGILVANGALTIKGTLTQTGANIGTNEALTSIASIATANIYSPSSALNSLVLSSSVLAAGATIAPLQVIASLASQAFFDFRGAVMSTASINLSAAQVVGVVQVNFVGQGGTGIGFMPIFKGVV